MDIAVTLICNPAEPALDEPVLQAATKALEAVADAPAASKILSPGVAADIFIKSSAPGALSRAVASALSGAMIDIAVQPANGREKRLLIADMDSTIIEQECIDELAEFAGIRAEISEITERAMRGELDFNAALRERVSKLRGLSDVVLEEAFSNRITLTPGARTLVQTMRARGAVTALVSGGFTYFTKRVAEKTGFHVHQANKLVLRDGALTGDVEEPILGKAAKEEALQNIAGAHRLRVNETMAVGDGANDLAMLNAAGLGVAFRAKPAVAQAADVSINHGDLTALLYLQGIPHTDFAH